MKILLAGAFGHVGSAILKELVDAGHNVVAADIGKRKLDFDGYLARTIDFTNVNEVKGCCEDVDMVITNLALLQASDLITPEEVDYQSNMNLLEEAKKSGVKHFVYISEYKMESAPYISLFAARLKFEEALKESGLTYTIFRPVGFFFDIAHRMQTNVEMGKIMLHKSQTMCNVMDQRDFAKYLLEHMEDENVTLSVGGKEEYSYFSMARIFFRAAGIKFCVSYTPKFIFNLIVKTSPGYGRGYLQYDRWCMTEDRVAELHYGESSFEQYVYSLYGRDIEIQ